ncbi:MAG: hypothetical protein R3268_07335, partial [Acidiferrobacterales bacterium]|nr:hypothetical protein [Acidiferrobacterales bacterium]
MSSKRTLSILILILFILLSACREEEATSPTPEATDVAEVEVTDTAVPQPTDTVVSQPESIGLLPLDNNVNPAPTVIGQNPALGEELPLDGTLEIYFDQPMNPEA